MFNEILLIFAQIIGTVVIGGAFVAAIGFGFSRLASWTSNQKTWIQYSVFALSYSLIILLIAVGTVLLRHKVI